MASMMRWWEDGQRIDEWRDFHGCERWKIFLLASYHEVVNWREDQPLLQFRETAAHVTTMHNTSLLLGENYTVGININIYGRNLGSPTYGCNLSIELM